MGDNVIEFIKDKRTMKTVIGEALELYKDGKVNKESAASAINFLNELQNSFSALPPIMEKKMKSQAQIERELNNRSKL